MDGRGGRTGADGLVVLGAALVVFACFLPWSEGEGSTIDMRADMYPVTVSIHGIDRTYGKIALGAGIALALAGLGGRDRRNTPVVAALVILGALVVGGAAAVAYSDLPDGRSTAWFRSTTPVIDVFYKRGPGLWLALIGAALVILGGVPRMASAVGKRTAS